MVLKLAGVASFGACRLKLEQICEWIAAAYECTEFFSSLGGAPLPSARRRRRRGYIVVFSWLPFPDRRYSLAYQTEFNDSTVDARVCHARHRRNHHLDEKVVVIKCSRLNLSCR